MISFITSLILLGGFYDWNVAVTGIVILLEILLFYQKKKAIFYRKRNYVMYIPVIVFAWMLMVSFWSLDVSEHILGIIRGVVLLVWMYLSSLMEEEEKERILAAIPYLGALMTGVGILSLAEENFAAYFWQARRFGGCFQYPNTCALFLLIGIIIQTEKWVQKKKNKDLQVKTEENNGKKLITTNMWKEISPILIFLILLLGIFLTGCRSIILLAFFWGIYKALKIKKIRIPFLIVTVVSLTFTYGYGVLVGDEQNIARIFTMFKANSTIFGRLLYGADALSIAKDYPLGLGYGGYYFLQPVVQTGVYATRFIHNDWLQILVDYGIPAFVLVVIYLGYQLFRGKQSKHQKELLVVIMVAALADFHLQYMNIIMLMVLCLDLGEKDKIKKRKDIRENYLFTGVGIVAGAYLTVVFLAAYLGNYTFVLNLFPTYTKAQIESLQECADKEEAVRLADAILAHNEYVSQAYHTKIYAAVMEEEFLKAAEYIDKALEIKRYDVESYRMYDNLFEEMIKICNNKMKVQEAEVLMEKRKELPERLAALENETHPLAFRLRDQPQFVW